MFDPCPLSSCSALPPYVVVVVSPRPVNLSSQSAALAHWLPFARSIGCRCHLCYHSASPQSPEILD